MIDLKVGYFGSKMNLCFKHAVEKAMEGADIEVNAHDDESELCGVCYKDYYAQIAESKEESNG